MATTIFFLSFRALEADMGEMSRGGYNHSKNCIGSGRDWVGRAFLILIPMLSRDRGAVEIPIPIFIEIGESFPDSSRPWLLGSTVTESFKVWMSSILVTRQKSSACIEHPRASTHSKSGFMAFKLHVSDIFCKNIWDFHYCGIFHLGLFLRGPFMAQW